MIYIHQIKIECPVCNDDYFADPKRLKHGRQTTCSRKCSYRLRGKERQKLKMLTCPCGEVFRPKRLRQRCCSTKIIEVKGWFKKKDKKKIKLFRKLHSIKLEVWGRKKLKRLRLLDGNSYGKVN